MLFFVVALCLGSLTYAASICPNTGELPLTNSGINNYVVDWLELIEGVVIPFPFALNKCTSHSLVTDRKTSYYHACSNGVLATQEFNDSQCTNPVGSPKVLRIDNQTFGEVGYFECGGYNTYVELYVASNFTGINVCSNLQHIFAGLNACVDQTDVLGQTFSIYCNSKKTVFEWFWSKMTNSSGRNGMGNINNISEYTTSFYPSSTEYPYTTEYPLTTILPSIPASTSTTMNPQTSTGVKIGTSSQAPATTSSSQAPEPVLTTEFPNMTSTFYPSSSMMPHHMCDSRAYCFDWIIPRSTSCQHIATLQGTNIAFLGRMVSCHEHVSAAMGSNLSLWTLLLITILFIWY